MKYYIALEIKNGNKNQDLKKVVFLLSFFPKRGYFKLMYTDLFLESNIELFI